MCVCVCETRRVWRWGPEPGSRPWRRGCWTVSSAAFSIHRNLNVGRQPTHPDALRRFHPQCASMGYWGIVAQIQEDADATIAGERKVDVMEAVRVVSLGGAAKAHPVDFFYKLVQRLQAPPTLHVQKQDPMRRTVVNFSAQAIITKKHGKVVFAQMSGGLQSCLLGAQLPKELGRVKWWECRPLVRGVYRQKLRYVIHPYSSKIDYYGQLSALPLWVSSALLHSGSFLVLRACWCSRVSSFVNYDCVF